MKKPPFFFSFRAYYAPFTFYKIQHLNSTQPQQDMEEDEVGQADLEISQYVAFPLFLFLFIGFQSIYLQTLTGTSLLT